MRRNVSRTGIVRKHRSQRYEVKQWTDRLPDVPAFILGNGPSLSDFDITPLQDYFTIGINRAFKPYIPFDPTILMWQDISLWNTEYHKLHNTQSIKLSRDIADPRRIYYNFHLKGGPFKFDKTKTHVLFGRGNSGCLGVQLAVAIGCNPIILLGMDCKKGDDGRTDFYGDNKFHMPHTLDSCLRGLEFIKRECPTQIISCSDNNLWERQTLNEVIKSVGSQYAQGRQSFVRQLLSGN